MDSRLRGNDNPFLYVVLLIALRRDYCVKNLNRPRRLHLRNRLFVLTYLHKYVMTMLADIGNGIHARFHAGELDRRQ